MNRPIPENEEQRLRALDNYHILDSLSEAEFDRITQLAALICNVPISLISLIDEKRQWFKSKTGLEVSETAREIAFCQYAIMTPNLFEVQDATADERFRNNELVTGFPEIRFYAGQPLVDPDGHNLGTLCVIDKKPNHLTDDQKKALQLLADEVMALVIERRRKEELKYFEKLFQYSSDLICIAGADGYFKKVNPAFHALLGWQEKTLLKNSFHELVHPDDQAFTKTELEKLATHQGNLLFTNRIKTKNKTYRIIQWVVTPEPATGNFFAIGRDITEEKEKEAQLKSSKDRLKSFFEASQGLMCTHDEEGNFLSVNQSGAELLGYQVSELEGKKSLFSIVPEKFHPDLRQYLTEIFNKGRSTGLLNTLHKDGRSKIFMYNNVLAKDDDGKPFVIGSSIDITERFLLEHDLRRTKQMLEQTNRVARVGGWEFDLIKQKMTWSDITCEIHEVPADFEPDLAKDLAFYKAGYSRDKITELVNKGMETGAPWDIQLEIVTAKGREIWVRSIGSVEMVNGKARRMFGTFQDIDQQKRTEIALEVSENKYRAFFETSPVAIAINRHSDGKFISGNKALFDLVGYTEEEYRKLTHHDVTPKKYDEQEKKHHESLTNDGAYGPYEKEYVHKDGHHIPILLNGIRFNGENGVESVYSVIQDISERKQAERIVAVAREQAEQASLAKSEFLANMSHEIRTPLNGVIGFTNLVLKTDLNETQRQYLTIVEQSANGLLSVINDILDFSKIEAGKFELDIEKCDLFEIGSQAADIISFQAQSKGVEMLLNISPDVPRFIWADALRLKQVLINLLGNAVKFTDKGEIELKVDMLQAPASDGKTLFRFEVRDTGIGIHPEKFDKIFEAFGQEDGSTTKKYGGTGLGLSISNKLLALMGSRLQLTSKPGVGSTFYFDLDIKAENGDPEIWDNIDRLKNILVVDDNSNNRVILRDMLALKHIHATEAKNGLEAIQLLAAGTQFDAILMDYHMPFMDGLETVKKIRENLYASPSQLPIVLLNSSSDDEKALKAADKLSISHRLVKPIKMGDLYNVLSRLYKKESIVPQTASLPTLENTSFGKVLIVEDNAVNMLLTKIIIKKIAPEAIIFEAKNGVEGWKFCESIIPDIILMDVQMPEMNGYESTQRIRKMKTHANVPIIALTAGNVKGEREKCLEAGMDDFIAKPVVEDDIAFMFNKWSKTAAKHDMPDDTVTESVSVNLDKMKASIGNNAELLPEIKELLRTELENSLEILRKHMASQDLNGLHEWGHKLYGTTSITGLDHLAAISRRIERLPDLDKVNAGLLKDAEKEMIVVIDLLRTHQ